VPPRKIQTFPPCSRLIMPAEESLLLWKGPHSIGKGGCVAAEESCALSSSILGMNRRSDGHFHWLLRTFVPVLKSCFNKRNFGLVCSTAER
jgi:hypothetical protein